ncbi:hypothetical protein Daes_0431 [Pseudodesulfovibrio aespoeensis Aspo-2]|uniref:Uncharacterized protein n=1 Tax=Pseudodesulfovibrio aespoeensis (strain ATCC 700646 / DSM 10631 / Aspo-2) TaxID=643562 RepID=E6VX48_PSEA9|nr:hypothetical protein Daes_0431 [Pseudodesulfovibrio aespoeensis Aspo-2]
MSDYIIECRKTLRGQLREIQDENGDYPGITVTCPCGRTLAMFRAFRCFHCGIWFCSSCAKEHFGPDTSEHADPFKTGRVVNS